MDVLTTATPLMPPMHLSSCHLKTPVRPKCAPPHCILLFANCFKKLNRFVKLSTKRRICSHYTKVETTTTDSFITNGNIHWHVVPDLSSVGLIHLEGNHTWFPISLSQRSSSAGQPPYVGWVTPAR
jgi:hypothetical protein